MFTPESLKVVVDAIQVTWQQIGFDVLELCEDNKEAVEMCLDADRLLLNGGSETAHMLVRQACKAHNPRKVYQFLSTQVQIF